MSLSRVRKPSSRLLFGCVGALFSMLALSALDLLSQGNFSLPALVPPFGATVMIVFFLPESPMGRPRSVIGGHVGSALVANAVLVLFPFFPAGAQAALAVTLAGLVMFATRSFHPPGGATALLTVVAEHKLGFVMALCPMLAGAVCIAGSRFLLDRALAAFAESMGRDGDESLQPASRESGNARHERAA